MVLGEELRSSRCSSSAPIFNTSDLLTRPSLVEWIDLSRMEYRLNTAWKRSGSEGQWINDWTGQWNNGRNGMDPGPDSDRTT